MGNREDSLPGLWTRRRALPLKWPSQPSRLMSHTRDFFPGTGRKGSKSFLTSTCLTPGRPSTCVLIELGGPDGVANSLNDGASLTQP